MAEPEKKAGTWVPANPLDFGPEDFVEDDDDDPPWVPTRPKPQAES